MALQSQSKSSHLQVRIEALGQVWVLTSEAEWSPSKRSVPSLTLRGVSSLSGTFDDEEATLRLPLQDTQDIFEQMSVQGIIFPSRVLVSEYLGGSSGGEASDAFVLFDGEISVVKQNPEGRAGVWEMVLKSPKSATNSPSGLPAGETCSWVVFDGNCKVPKSLHTYPVTILSIDNNFLQVVASGGPGVPDKLFTKGYFEKDGVRVSIRFWSSGSPGLFYTSRAMPDSWLGQVVSAVAGCDQRIQTCREVYNNEQNNSAIGIKAVDYNPQQESGG